MTEFEKWFEGHYRETAFSFNKRDLRHAWNAALERAANTADHVEREYVSGSGLCPSTEIRKLKVDENNSLPAHTVDAAPAAGAVGPATD